MPQPNPVAFTIFNIDVMWYAIMITTGIIICVIVSSLRAQKHGMTADNVLNLAIITVPVGIIGARLYYIVFNWDLYAGDFLKMINFREGGLAIHGGLIFGMAMGALLCYIWKIRPLNALDLVVPSIALAQSIGRWGNYFNSEAHGGSTDLPWAVYIDGIGYHPTFLYESIWCLLLFFLLIYVDNHRKFEGQVLLLYGILYSLERFFVEALRTDSLMIGPFKQAQLLSLTVIVVFTLIYVIMWKRNKRKDE
ncbi:MAG: prolipoprotein diacylglyceryl transferase [Lentihominibacter sp.]|jgi:phosphatidylglycerol:prolipoprotein diacylglycerol transferase